MLEEGFKKRKYKFKSNTKGERLSFTIAIIISIIAFIVIYYYL